MKAFSPPNLKKMPLINGNKQMDPLTGEITTIKGHTTMSDKNDYVTECNTNK